MALPFKYILIAVMGKSVRVETCEEFWRRGYDFEGCGVAVLTSEA